jgi:molecular chaperone GrpE
MAKQRDSRAARTPEPDDAGDARAEGAETAERSEAAEEAVEAAPDLAAELADLNDRYLRLAAEYENYRKRTGRERLELRGRAQGDLVAMLIDALDDLGRVAHLIPETTTAGDVIAGVELVERKLLKQLETAGLERIAQADVPFDPNLHEAIAQVAAGDPSQDHTVSDVLQTGYRFGGQLLRPARVRVRVWSGESGAD